MKVARAFALHGDVPIGRTYAWNVVAVMVAVAAIYGAGRVGHLAVFLAIVAGLVAAAAVAVVEIERRIQRQADERVAAFRRLGVLQAQPGAPTGAASTEQTRHVA